MTSMRDSCREALYACQQEERTHTLISLNPSIENGLKGQINGLRKLSVLEWVKEHTEQNELFCGNILTNI